MHRTMVLARVVAEASLLSRWPAWLLSLLLLLLSAPTRVRADPIRAHLAWQRPVGTMCPSSAVLQADVEQLMGHPVFAPREQADLLMQGVVEDRPSGVRVQIEVRDPRGAVLGSRELSAPAGECASLRRALGLVLALLLDQHEADPRAARHSERTAVAGTASLGVLTATLPRADVGFGLALSLDPAKWPRVRFGASYWLPVVAETQSGVGASFQLLRAGLSACPRLLSSRAIGLWLCAGVELGGLRSTPRSLEGPAHQTRLLVQPGVELACALRISRHSALEAALGALANVLRPSFYYGRGDGETVDVYRPGIFGALLRIGLTID